MASSSNTSSAFVQVDEVIGSAFLLASYLLLVLPLSLYVLYLGFIQWKSKRSDVSWSVGHSDFCTYNLVVMEFFGLAGVALVLHGQMNKDSYTSFVGSVVIKLPWCGQLLFPLYTCVEQYLAVVRPMMYLTLKRTKSLQIRIVSSGGVWSLSLLGILFTSKYWDSSFHLSIMAGVQVCLSLAAVVFCCVSVLHVLVQPRPGDQKNKGRLDKTKRRAVRVIVAIMYELVFNSVGNIVFSGLCIFSARWCAVIKAFMFWLNLWSSVVLFLLFLQRAGKLPNCKRNVKK